MSKKIMAMALALSFVIGGSGLLSTLRADEAKPAAAADAAPAPAPKKHKHHRAKKTTAKPAAGAEGTTK